MKLLQKQGILNSVILYVGIVLGFINSSILFQRFLSLEEIGFFGLLTLNILPLHNQLSSLGFQSVITRYFPFYKTNDGKHGGFTTFAILITLAGATVVTLGFIFFREFIFSYYQKSGDRSLLNRYYYYIIAISFFTLCFTIQEFIARTVFKSVVPAFLREVVLRAFTTLALFLIMLRRFSFHDFINFYLLANILILLVVVFYIRRERVYTLSAVSDEVRLKSSEMIGYGLFSMLSGSAVVLVPSLGPLILKVFSGEAAVGVYSTFAAIAAVISLPAKALNTTSYQIIADAWKHDDINRIAKVYHKTSVVQLLVGGLLLIGLISNQRSLLFLLHKPEYVQYFNVFVLLGCGFLVDITGGLNQAIISFSKHYKIITRFLISGAILAFGLNYLLIAKLGIVGAAWGYLLTIFSLNFGYWVYLKAKFGLQPFNYKHLAGIMICVGCLFVGLSLPQLANYYYDVVYRSGIIAIIFSASVYFLKISEDINDLIDKVLMKKP